MLTPSVCQRAVFLAQSESTIRLDLASFRHLGISVAHEVTFNEALLNFAKFQHQQPKGFKQLFVCDERLAFTNIFSLLHMMAEQKILERLPLLVLSSSATTTKILLKTGISVLERPYSIVQLEQSLEMALCLDKQIPTPHVLQQFIPAPRVAIKPAPPVLTLSDIFKKGFESMTEGKLNKAKVLFKEVLRRQPHHVEAHLSLSTIYRRKQKKDVMEKHLVFALCAATRLEDTAMTQKIMHLLPEKLQDGNIFIHEALYYLKNNFYEEAIRSFEDAERTSKQPLHVLLARTCQFTHNPIENIEQMCDAFEITGRKLKAQQLRSRLLETALVKEVPEQPRWIDNFPLLRDTVNIVSTTAQMWRCA